MERGIRFYLLIATPQDELLVQAIESRQQLLIITALLIVLSIPVIWLMARQISHPLRYLTEQVRMVNRFDFSKPISVRTVVKEVDELASVLTLMKSTINQFTNLIEGLSKERDYNQFLREMSVQTAAISGAEGTVIYLQDRKGKWLIPKAVCKGSHALATDQLLPIKRSGKGLIARQFSQAEMTCFSFSVAQADKAERSLFSAFDMETMHFVAIPLNKRDGETMGLLCLALSPQSKRSFALDDKLAFIQALSGFAAVSLETRRLIKNHKKLLDGVVKMIAGTIDAKSPHTGGHCERVPDLTQMLAQAACESKAPAFADFDLNEEQWEALRIASWLHDCGKVTTPEHVIDKATKLETLYDRIHEVRMRFEVLKRDAEIRYLRARLEGGPRRLLLRQLKQDLHVLDREFAFVAQCNQGAEQMDDADVARLQRIGRRTWKRTLDDRLGLSQTELQRKRQQPVSALPVLEPLLMDRDEHLIPHTDRNIERNNRKHGFQMDVTEYQYNRGELYNLSVTRGTLTAEERYIINNHIVQTIHMLEQLTYPRYLASVPLIAGSHHETMDGTGFPRKLTKQDMPLEARILAVADVFEALTASDRPYKKAKSLVESLSIMQQMAQRNQIDADLFELMVSSKVYLQYARKHLKEEQLQRETVVS